MEILHSYIRARCLSATFTDYYFYFTEFDLPILESYTNDHCVVQLFFFSLFDNNKNMFKCTLCEKMFAFKSDTLRHKKSHEAIEYPCGNCSSVFTRRDRLARHMHKKNPVNTFYHIYTVLRILFL